MINSVYLETFRKTPGVAETLEYMLSALQIPDNILYLESKGLLTNELSGKVNAIRALFGELFDAHYQRLQISKGHEELASRDENQTRVLRSRGRNSESVRGTARIGEESSSAEGLQTAVPSDV